MDTFLADLGLTANEQKVFRAVCSFGRITYGRLAKQIDLNRTTIYSVARSLLSKGFLTEDVGGTRKYLVAPEPDSLARYFDGERQELERKEASAQHAAQELKNLRRSEKHMVPTIRFVEEDRIEQFLFDQSDKWNESMKKYDRMWWGFQDEATITTYDRWMREWWSIPSSKGISSRLVSNLNTAEQKLNKKIPQRVMKYWDTEDGEFSGSLWIAGDYIITIVTRQHPHYLIETFDPIMAGNLRAIFKQTWKRS